MAESIMDTITPNEADCMLHCRPQRLPVTQISTRDLHRLVAVCLAKQAEVTRLNGILDAITRKDNRDVGSQQTD